MTGAAGQAPAFASEFEIDSKGVLKRYNGYGGSEAQWAAVKDTRQIRTGTVHFNSTGDTPAPTGPVVQRSAQNRTVNGISQNVEKYNIGGNNFFKLRELGTALGFDVDYDAAANTAIVISR